MSDQQSGRFGQAHSVLAAPTVPNPINPIFIFFYFLFIVVSVVLSALFGNVMVNMVDKTVFGFSLAEKFPLTNFVFENFVRMENLKRL